MQVLLRRIPGDFFEQILTSQGETVQSERVIEFSK